MHNIITIISIVITLISTIISVYLGIMTQKLKKETKTIKWSDLQYIANFVYKKCKEVPFRPDIIFTESAELYHLAKNIS